MKIKTKIKCPCGFKTEVQFKRPGIMSPSLEAFNCEGCESKILAKFERHKDKALREQGQVTVYTNIVKPSDDLQLILMEAEQEKRNKANEFVRGE